jgi:hypothetical protein
VGFVEWFFLEKVGCVYRYNPNIYYFQFLNFYSMKKALLPIIVVVLLSVFIYSCSSDDDDSAASSVIPTPTAEPEELLLNTL